MTAKTILFRILVCLTVIGLWAWVAADDWEQEQELERAERERIQAIIAYNKSKLSPAQSEDYVDTTPLPVAEAEPTYVSAPVQRAKNSVVKAKKRIKKTYNKN
jgi:type II secretory pathway pseudopilin PulG